MEYKVYRVQIEKEFNDSIDLCPTTLWETAFEDTYSSKAAAIKYVQRYFAKSCLNDYVSSVHAEVKLYIISDKGMGKGKRIYNLYKTRGNKQ